MTEVGDVVLVIDMQRGFLEEGNPLYCGDDARKIIPQVKKLLDREVANGSTVFYEGYCDLESNIIGHVRLSPTASHAPMKELKSAR